MNCAGFLNLPEWQEKLQKILTGLGKNEILRLPVLGSENVERPWVALDSGDFYSAVETGIFFQGSHRPVKFPVNLVTSDPEIAIKRLLDGKYRTTFYSAAIGATFPVLKILSSGFEVAKPEKFISQNDAVSGFILSRMEMKNFSLEEATHDAQWEKIVPGSPNYHLHGLVTRNRLALQIADIFGCLIDPEKIHTTGINSLKVEDVRIARKMGYSIRLLGIAQKTESSVKATVEACLIPMKYFLAQTRGGSEIIYALSSDGQSQVYACPGTSCETVVRGILTDLFEPCAKVREPETVDKVENFADKFYLRFNLINFTDTMSRLFSVFAANDMEISTIYQPERDFSRESDNNDSGNVVFITGKTEKEKLLILFEEIKNNVKLASLEAFFRFFR
ncbi:MAG: hypothetical protein Kow0029_00380 [Candidatus Rifleibacteriota bacterium]